MNDFEKKLSQISSFIEDYPSDILKQIIEISTKFEGNERVLLLHSLYQVIANHYKKIGVEDLAKKIIEGNIH